MSRENVEIVQQMYDAYNRRDAATALSAFDPEVVWDARHHPDGRVYHGHAGIQEFLRAWHNLWESTHSEPERFLDAGDEVVVLTREMTRLKDSGLEVTEPHAEIYTLRHGKIIRWRAFTNPHDALEAVRLRE